MTVGQAVLILGAGGHARVVAEALHLSGHHVLGCLAPERPAPDPPGALPWLGTDDVLSSMDPSTTLVALGLGGTGDTAPRRALFEWAGEKGFRAAPVRHPASVISPEAMIAEGAQVLAGAIVQTGAGIGRNALVNTGAVVEHDSRIGDHAQIAPRACLCGGVDVGAGAFIGAGAVVLEGRRIGARALVGAGALVLNDVEEGARVLGVPARVRPKPEART